MSLRKNVLLATFGNVVPPLLALATQPLLAQGLGVDGRGAASAGVAPLMVAVSLCALGLPDSLNRFIASRAVGARTSATILVLLVVVGSAASCVIWATSSALGGGDESAISAIKVGALFVAPALAFQGLRGMAAGLSLWGSITIARCSQSLLLLAVVVAGFATQTLTVETAVIALALAQCAGALVLVVPVILHRKHLNAAEPPGTQRAVFAFGASIWIGAASGYLLTRIDQLLMVPLSGVTQLGLYAVAVSISEAVLVVNTGLREVIFSAEASQRDPARVSAATRVSNLVVIVLSCAAAAATPFVIAPLFGQEFDGAIPMVMVLLAATTIGNPGSVSGMALAAWGRPGVRSASIVIALMVNVVSIILLVPQLGGLGAAIATLLGNATAMVLILVAMRKYYQIPARDFITITRADIQFLIRLLRRRG